MTDKHSLDDALSDLRQQHARLEARIEAFNQQLWLNAQEEAERKRLQKLKLATKSRIVMLRAQET